MIDVTQITVALIGLAAAILTAGVIPWIKTKIGAQRYAQLQQIAAVAVKAAEQLIRSVTIPIDSQGAEIGIKDKDTVNKARLAYALTTAQTALAKQGITFDENTIRAAIEAYAATEEPIRRMMALKTLLYDSLQH